MITVAENQKIYDNREDSQVWVIKGVYNTPKDIILEGRDIDDPGYSNRFKPDYAGESEDYILLAWDESFGVLYKTKEKL